MNQPQDTISNFYNIVINSGLVNQNQWNYVLRLAKHRLTSEAEKNSLDADFSPDKTGLVDTRYLASLLVEQGWVTSYQVEQLLVGRSRFFLGPYLITEFIGQGGMGQVFKAVHRFMERQCAVKVLPTAKSTTEAIQGFMREIRMQAKLDHPHLVRAYDAGEDGNVHYLVTEYVPGMDLRRLVKHQGPLSVNQAASIIRQAALGLQYAHEQGLIHRDVKPGNILVTPEGVAKVSDVGLAGFAADLFSDPRAGKIVGTADYLSPEQIKAPLSVNTASDIYSLGCTMYYAICGKVPFPGGDTRTKLNRHLTEAPRHPRRFAPSLSDEFVDIIADMMEKDVDRRTQTCKEVASRLDAWASESSVDQSDHWSRGPWLAPPPPAAELDNDQSSDISMDSSKAEASGVSGQSKGRGKNQMDLRSLEIPSASGLSGISASLSSPTRQPMHQISSAMIIGLTVAIVLPPALVIGFVIGYLFRQ